jgi:hypothetical protein
MFSDATIPAVSGSTGCRKTRRVIGSAASGAEQFAEKVGNVTLFERARLPAAPQAIENNRGFSP